MLMRSKDLKKYTLQATDGNIGKVEEFYFDDKYWTVRYLIANTGGWLKGRKVLISPYALGEIDQRNHTIVMNVNKTQIELSPPLENDVPVSKQFEESYYGYYGWPTYWRGLHPWGPTAFVADVRTEVDQDRKNHWDPHLRSTHTVGSYHVHAKDGDIGRVCDFIIEDETWVIRYVVLESVGWLAGKKVLISPQWFERISALDSKVFTPLTREQIRAAPEYFEQDFIDRNYESNIFKHYGREGYWAREAPGLSGAESMKTRSRDLGSISTSNRKSI